MITQFIGFYAAFKEASSLIYTSASALMTSHPTYKFYVVGYVLFFIIILFESPVSILDLLAKCYRILVTRLVALWPFLKPSTFTKETSVSPPAT